MTGVVDISGTMTGFATIAAEGLGIAAGEVSVIAADTATAPRSPMSGGSVITYSTGRAVQRATDALRDKILAYAAPAPRDRRPRPELIGGVVQPKGTPERGLTLAQIGESLDGFTSAFEPLEGHGGTVPPVLAPLTAGPPRPRPGRSRDRMVVVLGYVIAQDVGRALNPAIIEGQLHGGATQGLGWALHEAMVYDEFGQLQTGTFLDYAIQTAPMVPRFRDDHRGGPGAGRAVRGEGDRRGPGVRRGRGRGQRGGRCDRSSLPGAADHAAAVWRGSGAPAGAGGCLDRGTYPQNFYKKKKKKKKNARLGRRQVLFPPR